MEKRIENEIEEAEKKLILLLGLEEKPVNELFIQKELFLLTQSIEELNNVFEFKKHYHGPFSEVIHDSLDDPLYFQNSFIKLGNKFSLTQEGKELFEKISNQEKEELLILIKFIREVYEKLDEDELLFIIYCSYPEFMEKSDKCKFLFNKDIKLKTINSILKKGLISEQKAEELKWC